MNLSSKILILLLMTFVLAFVGCGGGDDESTGDSCDGVTCGTNEVCSAGDCVCVQGYERDETDACVPSTDACAGVTCGDNASCVEGSCVCDTGFEGNPETGCTASDACADVTCGTNAHCDAGDCVCDEGFEGDPDAGCTAGDDCTDVTCGANAHCDAGDCVCDTGYEGDPDAGCTASDPCTDVTCGDNAHCDAGDCVCDEHYEGDADAGCTLIDYCDGITCGTNAHCVINLEVDDKYECVCDEHYEGDATTECTAIDYCDGVTCGHNAHCEMDLGLEDNYHCVCDTHYEGDATTECTGINYCATQSCGANAHCENNYALEDGWLCMCDEHYEGDADLGCTPINYCAGINCRTLYSVNSHCVIDTAEENNYKCECNDGFPWNADFNACLPDLCADVNCVDHASCDSTTGLCSCDEGYLGDAYGAGCFEDLCANVTCGHNAYCDPADGDCKCDEHFEGDADTNCTAIDYCDGVVCDAGKECVINLDVAVDFYECVCAPGTIDDGQGGCTDDPCVLVNCPDNSYCDPADSLCYCDMHYEGAPVADNAGSACTAIDYCDGMTCQDNASCVINLDMAPDYYECVCDQDYVVDPDTGDCVMDNCLNVTCGDNAFCNPLDGECYCDEGFMGDPETGCTEDLCFNKECPAFSYCDPSNGYCLCDEHYGDFDPIDGCTLIDYCDGVTCQDNASCHVNYDLVPEYYECTCDYGYVDDGQGNCVVGNCFGVACPDHSTCNLDDGSCVCDMHYEGTPLDGQPETACTEIDYCDGVTCGDHAACEVNWDVPDVYYECVCDMHYEGDATAGCTEIDYCAGMTCGDNATCHVNWEVPEVFYECLCNEHFEGDPDVGCTVIDYCENIDCAAEYSNYSHCEIDLELQENDYYECVCDEGFPWNAELGRCLPDLCFETECPDNSMCDPANGLCYCDEGFLGNPYTLGCYEDLCWNVPCGEYGQCDPFVSGCECFEHYTYDDVDGCVPIDYCDGAACDAGRTCVVDLEMYPDYYYCECDPGTVEVDGDCVPDPCLDIQCGDNATCDPYERFCFCDDFYEGDPDAGCTPIDYCAMAAQEYDFSCGTNSLCVFDPTSGGANYGMPITCVCEDEYVFDGSEANPFCAIFGGDCGGCMADPCTDVTCGDNEYCDMNGECVCDEGFVNMPIEGCVDLCAEVTCGENATCDWMSGECVCDEGFVGDPDVMCDTDLCYDMYCPMNSTCDPESGICLCDEHYFGFDPYYGCEMIDYCEGVECQDNAHCEIALEAEPFFACVCDYGYVDDAGTCVEGNCMGVECPANSYCDVADGSCLCDMHFEGDPLDGQPETACTEIDYCVLHEVDCSEIDEMMICVNDWDNPDDYYNCVCMEGYIWDDEAEACVEYCQDDYLEPNNNGFSSATFDTTTGGHALGLVAKTWDGEVNEDWFSGNFVAGQWMATTVIFEEGEELIVNFFSQESLIDEYPEPISTFNLEQSTNIFLQAPEDGIYLIQIYSPYDYTCVPYDLYLTPLEDSCADDPCGDHEVCQFKPWLGGDDWTYYTCECEPGYALNDQEVCEQYCQEDPYMNAQVPVEEMPFSADDMVITSTESPDVFTFRALPGETIFANVAFDPEVSYLELGLFDLATSEFYSGGWESEDGMSLEYFVFEGDPTRWALAIFGADEESTQMCLPYSIDIYVEMNPCETAPCGENQNCFLDFEAEEHYACECMGGYVWSQDGTECVEDPCMMSDCPMYSTCVVNWDAELNYDCVCDDYYELLEGECVCADHDYEENDVSSEATELILDQQVGPNNEMGAMIQAISSKGGFEEEDYDWYRFDLEAGEAAAIGVYFSDDMGDIDIALFDFEAENSSSYGALGSSTSSSDNESMFYISEEGGTYYVRIKPYTYYMCNPYTMYVLKPKNPCVGEPPVCGDPDDTHMACEWTPEEENLGHYDCVCNEGYAWWEETQECIEDLCGEVTCPDNSECSPADGECYCVEGYEMQGEECVFACNDDYNGNQTSADATELVLDQVVGPNDEIGAYVEAASGAEGYSDKYYDWYRFDLEAGEAVAIGVYFTHADGNINISLFDYEASNGAYDDVAYSWSYSDDEETVFYVAPESGTYYLEIIPSSYPMCNPYMLYVLKPASPCDAEPPVCGDPEITHTTCEWTPTEVDLAAYDCVCVDGYIWDEMLEECVEDLCYEVECQDNATCEQETGDCVCDDGYELQGEECVFPCQDDPYEDNDVKEEAYLLDISQPLPEAVDPEMHNGAYLEGVIQTGGGYTDKDYDWYSFDLEAQDVISIYAFFTHAEVDIDIALYTETGTYSVRSSASSTDDEAIEGYQAPEAGRYYLKLTPFGEFKCNDYELAIVKFENPCNTDTPLCGDPVETHMMCEWQYSAETPDAYECVCMDGYLWDDIEEACYEDLCYEVECPDNASCNQETGDCECNAGYEMQGEECVFACQDDQYEDNDDLASAYLIEDLTQPLPSALEIDRNGAYLQGVSVRDTEGTKDYDWFAFDLAESETISIYVAFSHADGDIDITLYDASESILRSSSSSSDDEYIDSYTAPSAGRYYLRMNPYTSGMCNPYDLVVMQGALPVE